MWGDVSPGHPARRRTADPGVMASMVLPRRARGPVARGDDGGFTLIEALVAVAILSIIVVGIATGTSTAARASDSDNGLTRADVLLTGFGEAVKALPYVKCAGTNDYQQAFDRGEQAVAAPRRLAKTAGTTLAVAAVDVTASTGCAAGLDPGVQKVSLTVVTSGRTRTGDIVKRDPSLLPRPSVASIDQPPTLTSTPGDAQASYLLTATTSWAEAGIFRYEWDCTSDGTYEITTTVADDSASVCHYAAQATPTTVTATLRVTDNLGQTYSTATLLTIPATAVPHTPPTATIRVVSSPTNTGSTVGFFSDNSSTDVVTWRWTFGDPSSGALNTTTCNQSSCKDSTHVFNLAGSYTVQLTVTDSFGSSNSFTTTVVVNQVGLPKPTASFTATPSTGVAPQRVAFDGSASHDAANNPVASYLWNVDGTNFLTGAKPTWTYTTPGTYVVSLTVTAANGQTNTTTRTVTLGALQQPIGFKLTDAVGEFFHDGHFYFSWTNIPRSPGDTIRYEIKVAGVIQFSCGPAFGTRTQTATANAAGTVQSFDFRVAWPFSFVCLWSDYTWSVRTVRTDSSGNQFTTAWTDPVEFPVTHT